jgi:hypothetical protein
MDQPSGVANRDAVGSHKFSRMGSSAAIAGKNMVSPAKRFN